MEQHQERTGDGPVELTETEKARWQTVGSAIDALSEGLLDGAPDREAMRASLAQISPNDLDLARIRDALPVPEDAGKYATDARS